MYLLPRVRDAAAAYAKELIEQEEEARRLQKETEKTEAAAAPVEVVEEVEIVEDAPGEVLEADTPDVVPPTDVRPGDRVRWAEGYPRSFRPDQVGVVTQVRLDGDGNAIQVDVDWPYWLSKKQPVPPVEQLEVLRVAEG